MLLVDVKKYDTLAFITIRNPKKRNALSKELCKELIEAINLCAASNTRVIVLKVPKTYKVWSSGLDMSEFPLEQTKRYKDFFDPLSPKSALSELIRSIEQYRGIVAAQVSGSVWGGATELIAACDLAAGNLNSSFALTPAKIGLPYSTKGIARLVNKIGSAIAKELFYTAKPIKAKKAYACGLLTHLSNTSSYSALEKLTTKLASDISKLSPAVLSTLKEQFAFIDKAQLGKTRKIEAQKIENLRRKTFACGDFEKGIRAFLNKTKPYF